MKLDAMLRDVGVTGNNEDVLIGKAAMEQARKAHAQAQADKFCKVATTYLGKLEGRQNALKGAVRACRTQLENELKSLKKLTTAIDYANETGNFVPAVYAAEGIRGVEIICRELGVDFVERDSELLNVPKDWKPAAKS